MSLTKEEMLELAKQHGGTIHGPHVETVSIPVENFLDYTSAIEQKVEQKYQAQIEHKDILLNTYCENLEQHKKQIALLRDALSNHKWHDKNCVSITESGCPPCDCGFESILDATQATAEAWEREVKARMMEPTPDMIEAGAKMFAATLHSAADFKHHAYHVYCAMVDAAELRNQQPDQPRKPCTCDGWCDGLCLEKEGKKHG